MTGTAVAVVPDLTEVADPRKRVYVVSFPNSGRTWLRVILSRYKQLLVGFDEFQVKLHAHYSASPASPQYIFYHARSDVPVPRSLWDRLRGAGPVYPLDLSTIEGSRVVFLVRDPRDVMVSHYYEVATRQRRFRGSLSAFVRDPWFGIDRLIDFCNRIHRHSERVGGCLFVSYEELSSQPEQVIRRICAFSDADAIDDLLRQSIAYASFDNMRALERENRLVRARDARGDAGVQKTRKGKVGGYKTELSTDDVAFLDGKIRADLVPFFHGHPFCWVQGA